MTDYLQYTTVASVFFGGNVLITTGLFVSLVFLRNHRMVRSRSWFTMTVHYFAFLIAAWVCFSHFLEVKSHYSCVDELIIWRIIWPNLAIPLFVEALRLQLIFNWMVELTKELEAGNTKSDTDYEQTAAVKKETIVKSILGKLKHYIVTKEGRTKWPFLFGVTLVLHIISLIGPLVALLTAIESGDAESACDSLGSRMGAIFLGIWAFAAIITFSITLRKAFDGYYLKLALKLQALIGGILGIPLFVIAISGASFDWLGWLGVILVYTLMNSFALGIPLFCWVRESIRQKWHSDSLSGTSMTSASSKDDATDSPATSFIFSDRPDVASIFEDARKSSFLNQFIIRQQYDKLQVNMVKLLLELKGFKTADNSVRRGALAYKIRSRYLVEDPYIPISWPDGDDLRTKMLKLVDDIDPENPVIHPNAFQELQSYLETELMETIINPFFQSETYHSYKISKSLEGGVEIPMESRERENPNPN